MATMIPVPPEVTASDPQTMPEVASTPAAPARVAGLQGVLLVTLGVIGTTAALSYGRGLFIPLVLSLVVALALAPVVRKLSSWMPRAIAAALVVGTLCGGVLALGYGLSDEAASAIAELPNGTRKLRQALRSANARPGGALAQLQKAVSEVEQTASEQARRPSTPSGVTPVQVVEPTVDIRNFMWVGSRGVLSIAGQLMLIVFLVYFLLASGELFKRKIVRLSGKTLSEKRITVQAIDQMSERVTRSLLHLVITSTFVGVVTWAGLWWLGVQYAGLWGLAAGVLNVVPYVGPTVVGIGVFVSVMLQNGEIADAALAGGVSVAVTTFEGFLVTPLLFAHLARLNPVAIFVSAIFWGWLWGGWGMILSLPLLVILKTIAETFQDLSALSELLAD